MPTKEQADRFWEWCGFKYIRNIDRISFFTGGKLGEVEQWKYPDGDTNELPPIDLNNLFKYAVKEDWDINFYFDSCSQTQDCIITLPNEKEYDGSGNTRKEALFWALDKVRSK